MKLLNLCEIVFRCFLILLAVFHSFRQEFKIMKAPVLVLVLSFLPYWLTAFFHMSLDVVSIVLYDIILFMACYLGSSLGFYDRYKWWDRIIHFCSGVAGVGFGIAIAGLNPGIAKWLSLLCGFTFSVSLHVFWEVLEYWIDCIFHGNAQRWQAHHKSNNHISPNALQPAGLVDTMNDLICCLVGAGLDVLIWWMW